MLWTFSPESNTCFFYRQEDKKAESSPAKDEENEEANASSGGTRHHGNPLFQSSAAEAAWKTVSKKRQETKARNYGEGLVSVKKLFYHALPLHLISIEPSK